MPKQKGTPVRGRRRTALIIRLLAQPLHTLILLYLALSACFILLLAVLFAAAGGVVVAANPAQPLRAFDFVYFAAVTYFTIGYGDILPVSQAARSLVTLSPLVFSTGSSLFMAIVVYKLLRSPEQSFLLSNIATLTTRNDLPRLEIRIYNNSPHEIVNLRSTLHLKKFLPTFPSTNHNILYDIALNREEYVYLSPWNYYVLTTAPRGELRTPRTIFVDGEFPAAYGSFELYLLVEAEFLPTGLKYTQLARYKPEEILRGHWRYLRKEDLEPNGRLNFDRFNEIVRDQEAEPPTLDLP